MLFIGKEIEGDYDYVSISQEERRNGRISAVTAETVFANICEERNGEVYITRNNNFGKTKLPDLVLPVSEFEREFILLHCPTDKNALKRSVL